MATREQLETMTLAELRALAQERHVESVSKLRKADLVQQLLQADIRQASSAVTPPEPTEMTSRLPVRPSKRAAAVWSRVVVLGKRCLGVIVQVVGVFGVILTLLSMLVLPFAASRTIVLAQETLTSTATSIQTAAESLQLAGDSLGEAAKTLNDAGVTVVAADNSLESVKQLLRTTADVAGNDVPTTIEAARLALVSAESGALAIDQVLRTLSSVGWLTGVTYDPEQSLDVSLVNVATELEPLPESLRELQSDLDATADDIEPLQSSLETVTTDLDSFSTSLTVSQEQMYDQAADLKDWAAALEEVSNKMTVWVWVAVVVIEMILIGVTVEQCAVFFVGRRLWNAGRANT
ncbi:MAG: Rho termination factor N-terminal domain-containing protein [Anaerolineae bacterium]|nr:Rho termination factor N-terminal domain-containing protein [Anaerolineae bacterium]